MIHGMLLDSVYRIDNKVARKISTVICRQCLVLRRLFVERVWNAGADKARREVRLSLGVGVTLFERKGSKERPNSILSTESVALQFSEIIGGLGEKDSNLRRVSSSRRLRHPRYVTKLIDSTEVLLQPCLQRKKETTNETHESSSYHLLTGAPISLSPVGAGWEGR